jgi:hypothetical protein
MTILDFEEKIIRKRIYGKAKPKVLNKRAKHDKGLITLDGKVVARVKIPNHHTRVMKANKSKHIATALKLSDDQFNEFVICDMSSKKYFELLRSKNLI